MIVIDRCVQWLGLVLARTLPSPGGFFRLAYAAAGAPVYQPLPSDHRASRPQPPGNVQAFAATSYQEGTLPEGDITAAAVKCSDPQYCYLHGYACACCGGSDKACPSGTAAGSYWSFCCSDRRIFFRDCCGNKTCPSDCPWCNNSNQPNWCAGAGNNQYVCTLAEDHGPC
jgi:methylamine dehydrogenase light chain